MNETRHEIQFKGGSLFHFGTEAKRSWSKVTRPTISLEKWKRMSSTRQYRMILCISHLTNTSMCVSCSCFSITSVIDIRVHEIMVLYFLIPIF